MSPQDLVTVKIITFLWLLLFSRYVVSDSFAT